MFSEGQWQSVKFMARRTLHLPNDVRGRLSLRNQDLGRIKAEFKLVLIWRIGFGVAFWLSSPASNTGF